MNARKQAQRQWSEILAYTQANIERTKLRLAQLESLLGVFRGHADAGDPAPTDLLAQAKAARLSHKTAKK